MQQDSFEIVNVLKICLFLALVPLPAYKASRTDYPLEALDSGTR